MTEAVRSVKHGVAVVPHDFKAHLERASAYKPERKKYSGYDEPVTTRQVPSEPMWQSVVEDWHQSDSIEYNNSIDDDSTRERSLSQSSDMVDLSNASDKQERQPIKVEKLSPTLLDEWKKAQAQGMIKSLDKKAVNKDDSEAKLRHRSASGDSSSYVRQTASVDSVLSARSTGSDIILPPTRTSSNGSVHSTHSRIMTPPAYVDFTKPPPSTAGGLGDFVRPYRPNNTPSPPVIAAGSASYPNVTYPAPAVFGAQQSYVRPQPVNNFMIPGVTNTGGYNVQPIGTPALGAMRQHMVPMHAPVQTPMAQLPNFSPNLPWSLGDNTNNNQLPMVCTLNKLISFLLSHTDTWFNNYHKVDNCISRLTDGSPRVTAVSPWLYPQESACNNYQCDFFLGNFLIIACIMYFSAAARIKMASSRARKSLCLPTEQQL